jgi:hypothetical protein
MAKELQNSISDKIEKEISKRTELKDFFLQDVLSDKAPDFAADYPFCSLPFDYFERLKSSASSFSQRTLLSVKTWDGRDILSVISQ